jgi:Sulfotransferase domain
MRVIGAGFGRTGTTSLKAALEELGFGPSYTLGEVFRNPEHVRVWEAASDPTGEGVDWEGFLAGYGVAVDWPACTFYEELIGAFPEASVILTVRDPAHWYESTRSTIHELRRLTRGPLPLRAAFALAAPFAPGPAGAVRLAESLVWEGTFEGRFEDRDYAMGVFERHNETVRLRVPPERLLVFDVREGWEPLCDFLGVEVPDGPFPRLNEAREMRLRLLGLVVLSAVAPALAGLAALAAVAATVFLARRVAGPRKG